MDVKLPCAKKLKDTFGKYNFGFLATKNSQELFPQSTIKMNATEKYLIGTGITLLGTFSTGAGTIAGLSASIFGGQKLIFDTMRTNFQKATCGVYVVNVTAPGALPKAILFNALDGSTVGWYYTTIRSAPTMQYHIYLKFLQGLKETKKTTECN